MVKGVVTNGMGIEIDLVVVHISRTAFGEILSEPRFAASTIRGARSTRVEKTQSVFSTRATLVNVCDHRKAGWAGGVANAIHAPGVLDGAVFRFHFRHCTLWPTCGVRQADR